MADKTINELPSAESVGSEDLFVLEQGGSAKSVSGAVLTAFVEARKDEQIAEIDAEGERVLESIPSDYTELSGDVVELKSATDDLTDCVQHNLIPYACNGSDDHILTVVQNGNEVTISGTSDASDGQGYTKVLITDHIYSWNGSSVPSEEQVYPIKLISGHTYKLKASVISGTRSAGTGTGKLYFRVIDSSNNNLVNLILETSETTGEQTFVSSGESIQIRVLVARLMTLTNCVLRIELSDITEEAALSGKQNTLTFDNSPTENSTNPVKSGGVYDSIGDVKHSIDIITEKQEAEFVLEQGGINGSTGENRPTSWGQNGKRVRTAGYVRIPIHNIVTVEVPDGYLLTVFLYSDSSYTGYLGLQSNISKTGDYHFNCEYIRLMYNKTDTSEALTPEDLEGVKLYAGEIIANEEITKANISMINTMPVLTSRYFDRWTLSESVNDQGEVVTLRGMSYSSKFSVSPGTLIYSLTPEHDSNNKNCVVWAHEYSGDTWLRRNQILTNEFIVVSDDADSMRIVFGYPTSESVTITDSMLRSNFKVKISFDTADWLIPKTRPTLVAFGASTTTGSIKHFSGEDSTTTLYKFPEYIADKLGMDAINLGVGTTGFLSRASGDKKNFLDQIYTNDTALSKANIVIIMFGYGNDEAAGLPIGSYDDYYPYDAEGYHPSGSAGVTTMLSKGITLMGALNWCIKWINEKYPNAELIPIFSAPSANKDREITMTAQTEGAGIAPYKLTFADPYDSSGTAANQGIKAISEELQKLKAAMNIHIIDQFFDGNVFSWYSTYATNADGTYALFSTTGDSADSETWAWNSHPNDNGYAMYARNLAGRIAAMFGYRY